MTSDTGEQASERDTGKYGSFADASEPEMDALAARSFPSLRTTSGGHSDELATRFVQEDRATVIALGSALPSG
jgi:hypothetical protein